MHVHAVFFCSASALSWRGLRSRSIVFHRLRPLEMLPKKRHNIHHRSGLVRLTASLRWKSSEVRPSSLNTFCVTKVSLGVMGAFADGVSMGTTSLKGRACFVLGRSAESDLVMEHPSVSRFHAALELTPNREVYMHDLESTHGTFVNKSQVPQGERERLRVGDHIKLGASSRVFVLHGPEELKPPEGVSKAEARRKAKDAIKERRSRKWEGGGIDTHQGGKAELHSQEGAWGQSRFEDLEEEEGAMSAMAEITWRNYEGELSEKQERTKQRLEKKLRSKEHAEKEAERILAKDDKWEGGLSSKQQERLSKCRDTIESLEPIIEDLEQQLNDSIREKVAQERGRVSGRTHAGAKMTADKRRRHQRDDDEDDEFYDRTEHGKSKREGRHFAGSAKRRAQTLPELVERKRRAEMNVEEARSQLRRAETKVNAEREATTGRSGGVDELDRFMSDVKGSLHTQEVERARRELEEAEREMKEADKLLDVADPQGIYRKEAQALSGGAAAKKGDDKEKGKEEEQGHDPTSHHLCDPDMKGKSQRADDQSWTEANEEEPEGVHTGLQGGQEGTEKDIEGMGGYRLLTREQLAEAVKKTGSVENVARKMRRQEEEKRLKQGLPDVQEGGLQRREKKGEIANSNSSGDKHFAAGEERARQEVATVLAAAHGAWRAAGDDDDGEAEEQHDSLHAEEEPLRPPGEEETEDLRTSPRFAE